ncbi:TRAP transporter substrate-binding protein [Phytohalomonas tamaricis]|uniref:TRAP transporter substrate-binding protein n=1 Tax=Phytohalomonas tamaricis TaxID=2081032 RepID=UPI000D0BDC41|nr:TRAP transporter substrate-binding protein [Phytohalomonas tamaricis]
MLSKWLHTASLAGTVALMGFSLTAEAATTLRFSHFWPANSAINQQVFQVWADTVEKESNGELKVPIFPSETLSKSTNSYQGVVNGISDIAATAQGYTAGRFPLSQVVELPGISKSSTQGSCIAQTLFNEGGAMADEYRDSHVLFMFTTGPGFIHTRETPIEKPTDLAGLRIRRPTVVVGEMLTALGAQSVGMPAPEAYTSMQRGVIDGTTLPWEGMKTFRLNELADHHTEMPLYSTLFVATMNERAYQRLPDNLKKVIDDNSGMKWALKVGEVFDNVDLAGRKEAQAKGEGDHILTIADPLNDPAWGPPLKQATDKYLNDLEKEKLPASEVYQQAQAAREQCATAGDQPASKGLNAS